MPSSSLLCKQQAGPQVSQAGTGDTQASACSSSQRGQWTKGTQLKAWGLKMCKQCVISFSSEALPCDVPLPH